MGKVFYGVVKATALHPLNAQSNLLYASFSLVYGLVLMLRFCQRVDSLTDIRDWSALGYDLTAPPTAPNSRTGSHRADTLAKMLYEVAMLT